jgi:hypothetical protein
MIVEPLTSSTMAKRTKSLASRTPPQVKPLVKASLDPCPQPGHVNRNAAHDPGRVIEKFAPGDKERLIDAVAQVCVSDYPLSLL